MRVAVYSITRDRLDFTHKSFKLLRKMAGCDFDLFVADNGSKAPMVNYLKDERRKGNIKYLKLYRENMGQNIAANHLLDEIAKGDYTWVMRWDNDAAPRTRRFLRKLVRCAERFLQEKVFAVYSPQITRLEHPPKAKAVGNDIGFDYEVVEILGGICRLHHVKFFDGWRFSPFGPLGFGEAAEVAQRCAQAEVPLLRIPHLEVEHMHGHSAQAEMLPEEHTWERREVGRYVSYGL